MAAWPPLIYAYGSVTINHAEVCSVTINHAEVCFVTIPNTLKLIYGSIIKLFTRL